MLFQHLNSHHKLLTLHVNVEQGKQKPELDLLQVDFKISKRVDCLVSLVTTTHALACMIILNGLVERGMW